MSGIHMERRRAMKPVERNGMSGEPTDSEYMQHIKEFNRELFFLHKGLISFRSSIEKDATPESQIFEYFNLMEGESSSKQNERKELAFDILMTLSSREEPFTMGELSTAIGVSLSTSTRLVSKFVESNLVERLSDPDDRRLVRVTLTEKGLAFFRSLEDYLASRTSGVLNQFTEEERILLILLLRKLSRNIPH